MEILNLLICWRLKKSLSFFSKTQFSLIFSDKKGNKSGKEARNDTSEEDEGPGWELFLSKRLGTIYPKKIKNYSS